MMRTFSTGEQYPEMSIDDYNLLISQLAEDDEIKSKADAIRYIEDSVFELDDRCAIPMRWLKAWCIHANETEKIIVNRVMQEWLFACDLEDAKSEE